jgi:hypothetical protein
VLLAAATLTLVTGPPEACAEGSGAGILDLSPSVVGFELQTLGWIDLRSAFDMVGIEYDSTSTRRIGERIYLRFKDAEVAERARVLHQQLDTPPRTVAVHMQLLLALEKAPVGAKETRETGPLVADPAILSTLTRLFRFPAYRLLSTSYQVTNTSRLVETQLEGVVLAAASGRGKPEVFDVDFKPIYLNGGQEVIQIRDLEIDRTYPADHDLLETTLNVRDGEVVIVGGSNLEGRTYAVVIKAETVDAEKSASPVLIRGGSSSSDPE